MKEIRYTLYHLCIAALTMYLQDIIQCHFFSLQDYKEAEFLKIKKSSVLDPDFISEVKELLAGITDKINKLIESTICNMDALSYISDIRQALASCAKIICAFYLEDDQDKESYAEVKQISAYLHTLFNEAFKDSEVHFFLLRCIKQTHGYSNLRHLMQEPTLEFLNVSEEEVWHDFF